MTRPCRLEARRPSRAFVGACLAAALFLLAIPTRAHAQGLAITSGPGYGTYAIGDVELPLAATGGTGGPYTWSIVGSGAPAGMSFRTDVQPWMPVGTNAEYAGIVTVPGNYSFTLQVSDGVSTVTQTATLTVASFVVKTPYNLSDAFVGVPFSQQLEAFGATVTWAPNGSLPPGLSLSSTGLLSGTPTTAGTYNVQYSITDGTNTVYWGHSLTVYAVQITTDGQLPYATFNQNYTQTILAAGGTGGYTYNFSGGLPNGLTFNAGSIAGTPTQWGRWTFSVTATDSSNNSYTKNMSLVVVAVPAQLPQVTPYGPRLDDCSVGINCTRALGNWSPAQPPFTWSASGLPAGMSIRSGSGVTSDWIWPGDGELYGTPTTGGDYVVTVTVTDATGASATNVFPLHVSALFRMGFLPNGTIGVQYSTTFRILGGSGTYSAAVSGGSRLPGGLTFDGTSLTVSGNPTEGGTFQTQFTFGDGQNNALTLTDFPYFANAGNTSPPLQIQDSDLGVMTLNQSQSRQLNACCRASVVWALEGSSTLPPGLQLSSTGMLAGTPTTAGSYTFVVRATDASASSDYTTRQLSVIVTPIFVSISQTLPFGNSNTFYSTQLQASGGTGPYTWTLAPGNYLPPGLTLTSDGLLSGTPTGTGQFFFTVNIRDTATLDLGLGYFSLAIYPSGAHPPLSIATGGNFGTWSIGSIETELDAQNGVPPYSWSALDPTLLPTGLSVRPDGPPWFSPNASGGIIGVATVPGSYSFTLRVTDSSGATVDLPATMHVVPLTIKELWSLPDGFTNTAYSYTLTALGNTGAPTWSAGTCGSPGCQLPPGLQINSATGEIYGTPTTAGFYNVQIGLSADGATIYWNLNLSISAINISASPTLAGGWAYELPNAAQGQSYSVTFSASGGTGGFTYSAGGLPPGLTLNASTGAVSGTYNGGTGGRWTFAVTATDNSGESYSRQFAIRGVAVPAVLPSIMVYGQRFDDCTLGMGCNRGLFVSGGAAAPFTWSATGLPTGMSLRPAGGINYGNGFVGPAGDAVIWGVPTELGDFNVAITVTDATGAQASNTFPLHVSELWQETRIPNGQYGVQAPYPVTLRTIGGTLPYTTTLESPSPFNRLAAGLSLDSASGVVQGTPIETGSFSPDLLIADNAGHHLRQFNYFFVSDAGTGTIQINTGSDLGYWTVGTNMNFQFFACCVPSLVWSLDSSSPQGLPPGTTLDGNSGLLAGKLTTAGTYVFTLRAADANFPLVNFAVRQFTLVVTPMTQQTSFTLPYGNVNVFYSQPLQVGGATPPVSFALAPYNVLPPGLSLSSAGVLSGTPTEPGQVTFSVIAADAAGNTIRLNFALSIYPTGTAPPLYLSLGPNLGPFMIGQISFALSTANTSGGVPYAAPQQAYHYSITPGANVIPGMRIQDGPPLPTNYPTFNPVPIASFIGVVTTPGVYTTSIRVTDSVGTTFDQPITLTVSPLTIVSPSPIAKATVNSPYSYFLAAAGGSGSYSWSSTNLPSGLSLDAATGELHGTPSSTGSPFISLTVSDTVSHASVTGGVNLTVNPFAITTETLPPATAGQVYPTQQISAPGCASCTWSTPFGGIPNGLTFNGSGQLSGTPTGSGFFTFTVRATPSSGPSVDKLMSLQIDPSLPQAMNITNGSSFGTTTVGGQATTLLTVLGGTPPYAWSVAAGGLPPGITLVNSGDAADGNLAAGAAYLVGRALQPGSYAFTLAVTDATATTVTRAFTWNISALNLQYFSLPLKDTNNNAMGPALVRGSSYTQPLLAIGGTSRYTWSATLPAGLSLNASTGVITGTPEDDGNFNVPVTIADDAGNTLTNNLSLNISGSGLTFGANPNLGSFAEGGSVTINLLPSGGTSPYTITPVTPLPPGFSLEIGNAVLSNGNPATSYFLAGNPLASGVFTFTLQLQDSASNVEERTFTLTVSPATFFTTSPLADASVNAPYSAQLVAFDGTGAFAWTVASGSGLPAGLTLSSSGLLSGTPTTAGNYFFNAVVTDSTSGLTATFGYSLKVSPLSINGGSTLPLATVLQPYSYAFAATGAGSVNWSIGGNLPNGLSVNGGTISGTPLVAGSGTFTLTVTASSGGNSVTRRFTLFVVQPNTTPLGTPVLQTELPDASVGQSYGFTLSPTGGVGPYQWTPASPLPPGLTLISGAQLPPNAFPDSTMIGGQPTAAGDYAFDLVLTDANGTTTQRTFSLHVSAITILSGSLRNATTGQPYNEQLTAVGGTAPYSFTAALPPGSPAAMLLPAGITLSPSGLLSGTTQSTGNYTFVVTVHDAAGNTFTRTYTLSVNNVSNLRIGTGNVGDIYVGGGIGQDLFTNGGSTYTWSAVGPLPPGLFLAPDPTSPGDTMLTGAPSVPGVYSYTLQATDTANPSNVASRTFTLNVSPMQPVAPSFMTYTVPEAQLGVAYSTTIRMAGGTPPYTFSASPAGPLPPGMTLGADGTFSGTPTATGAFSVGVIATDATGALYHLPLFSFVVTPAAAAPPLTAGQDWPFIDDGSVGLPFRFALIQQRGGRAPFVWSVASGSALPPGLAIVSGANGVPDHIAGAPTTAGQYAFTLVVTDADGESMDAELQLNVSPIAVTPDALVPGVVGAAYSANLAPIGGVGPYTIQAISYWDLPPGLTLAPSGALSGTPTNAGLFLMRVLVTDSVGNTLSKLLPITIDDAAGEAPAATFASRAIQLSYVQTFPDPGPIAVGVNTTSGVPPVALAIEGLPSATLSVSSGTAPLTTALDLHVTSLPVGTYTGVLALSAPTTPLLVDNVPVTVTVTALPPCTFSFATDGTSLAATGGSGSVTLNTGSTCAWTATSSQSWLTFTSPASGTGGATIGFTAAPNIGASARTATITVNGAVYTVTEFGSACSFVITPMTFNAPASGGTLPVTITASDNSCTWSASGLGATPNSGTGSGSVTVTIPPNTAAGVQVLTATIATQTLTVNESGIDCTAAINPSMASFTDAGGLGSATVTTPASCGYSTTSSPAWVAITAGGSGTGSGTLQYTVSANSATTPRNGSIVIGGQALAISQAAAACTVTLDTANVASPFSAIGGAGDSRSIGVTTNGDNCAWSVSANANWISFAPNASFGSGAVSLTAAPNPDVTPRSATISIGGQSVTVAQAGQACSFVLQSATGSVPAAGGSGSVGVVTASVCPWTEVSSDPSWLSATSSNTGSGDASFIAQPNPNVTPRSATITIAGLPYTVTQPAAACTYALGTSSATYSGDGVTGASVTVTSTSPSCTPAPVSYASWISVDSTSFSGTSGSITYSVQPNPLAVSRAGIIQVGDQSFGVYENLSQSACLYSLNAYGAVFNRGGGGGDVFGSANAVGCDPGPTIGTDQPSFITLGPLSGPTEDIFTQPFSVSPFDTPLTAVIRRGRITFGGQLFVVKQVSW